MIELAVVTFHLWQTVQDCFEGKTDMALCMYSVKRAYPLLLLCWSSLGLSVMLGLEERDHRQDWVVLLQVKEASAGLLCRY